MNDKVNFDYRYLGNKVQRPADPKKNPLQYFLDTPVTESVPEVSQFEDWPLSEHAYQLNYDFVPKKRVMFQPKKTANHEVNVDYYVSPRMFIRYTKTWVTDVMYADSFQVEAISIVKEVGGPWNIQTNGQETKPYGIEFEIRSRCHILKSFKFEWVLHS